MAVVRKLWLLVFVAGVAIADGTNDVRPDQRVAVTFDDLPFVNISGAGDEAKRDATTRLLDGLVTRDIPATGFVNESQLYDDGELVDARVDMLNAWLDAGMALGNHSYSHPDLHNVSLSRMQEDVLQGERVTRELMAAHDLELRYFRHPFLHTGRDIETKRGFETFLADHGYRVAPVTIDNSEWIFARAYMLAKRSGDDELAVRIGRDYVDYMLEMFAFYEDQSEQLFDRNIAQVLLVHANELNSDWFGELADRLSANGYDFTTLDDALADPAYDSPDTFTGPGGITWIHRWAITREVDPAMFRGEPTTPDYVLELTRLPEHAYEATGN